MSENIEKSKNVYCPVCGATGLRVEVSEKLLGESTVLGDFASAGEIRSLSTEKPTHSGDEEKYIVLICTKCFYEFFIEEITGDWKETFPIDSGRWYMLGLPDTTFNVDVILIISRELAYIYLERKRLYTGNREEIEEFLSNPNVNLRKIAKSMLERK